MNTSQLLRLLATMDTLLARKEELDTLLERGKTVFGERRMLTQAMPRTELLHALLASGDHPHIFANARANSRYYSQEKLVTMVMLLDEDLAEYARWEQEQRRVQRHLQRVEAQLYPPGISVEQRREEIGRALVQRTQRKTWRQRCVSPASA